MDNYKFICKVSGTYTGWTYWIIQYQDGMYSWGYNYRNKFAVSPDEFDSQFDALKAIHRRDGGVEIGAPGNGVMF